MRLNFSLIRLDEIFAFSMAIFLSNSAHAHSASIEYGTGNKTEFIRAAMQWSNGQPLWQSTDYIVTSHWDLSIAQWREKHINGSNTPLARITDIGITPIFRLQKNVTRGLYSEAGVGAHYLSDLYDHNSRKLSTHLEFGSHLGVGYIFDKVEIGLKFQHFSNAGIKKPNNGVNYAVIQLKYSF